MILRKRDKEHADAIIKYCTDNGMSVESTMGFWNHLVRLFKRMELLEGRAAKTGGAVDKQPTTEQSTPCSNCGKHVGVEDNPVYTCPQCVNYDLQKGVYSMECYSCRRYYADLFALRAGGKDRARN